MLTSGIVAALVAASSIEAARPLALKLWLWFQESPLTTPTPAPTPTPPTYEDNWFLYIWHHYLNRPFPIGSFSLSVLSLIEGVVVLLLAFFVSRWLRRFLEQRLGARTHIDPGTQYTLLRLTHYLIVIIGILVAVRLAIGADLTSLAVLFTALSVGIGFGLQYLAGDIASGFVLLFERPLRVGDFITVKGATDRTVEGRVMSINLRTTVVMTNDHVAAVVPNSKLVNDTLINWTYRERRSRITVPVGVSYGSDVELVTRTLLRAAEGVEHLLEEPKPSVQFMGFGDSSLDFRLLVWTARPRRYPQIKSDVNYRIWNLFKETGIEIPFPQRDLHVRSGTLKVETDGRSDERGMRNDELKTSDR